MQGDLFTRLEPTCGDCRQLGDAINTGIRYCWGELTWRWAEDRVPGCSYREKPTYRWRPANISEAEVLGDLLTSPRHDITPKARKELTKQLKSLEQGRA